MVEYQSDSNGKTETSRQDTGTLKSIIRFVNANAREQSVVLAAHEFMDIDITRNNQRNISSKRWD
jgi:hypothetical protein